MLYPLKFKPRFLEKMWGGRLLERELAKPLPPGVPIGESWELFDFPPGVIEGESGWVSSVIANGPFAGQTLHQLIEQHGPAVHGQVKLLPTGQFPILIKYLDARENLSVQVHPDANYAAGHPGAHLKTEAWYVVRHEPGARLYKGLRPGVTREAFSGALRAGTVEELIRTHVAKVGQCHFLPSGTVHALGAGILVAEVQTPSDTTFRVFDFNRIDPATGQPRNLHIDEALACIDFDRPDPPAQVRSHTAGYFTTVSRLAACPFFTIEKVRFTEGIDEMIPYDQPVVWMILEGHGQILVDGPHDTVAFSRGETLLLPAGMQNPRLRTDTDCVWLEITFPG